MLLTFVGIQVLMFMFRLGSYGCLVLGPHFMNIRLPAVGADRDKAIVESVCSKNF